MSAKISTVWPLHFGTVWTPRYRILELEQILDIVSSSILGNGRSLGHAARGVSGRQKLSAPGHSPVAVIKKHLS